MERLNDLHSNSELLRVKYGVQAVQQWDVFKNARGTRERSPQLSEIMTDTRTICESDTGQCNRSAMATPRHERTPFVIEVTSRPGKYELHTAASA